VAVIGGGDFGRGLAAAAARAGAEVVIHTRKRTSVPKVPFRTTDQLADAAGAELIFLAVPSEHVARVAESLGRHLDGSHLMVHVSRGLAGAELATLSQVLRRITPCRRLGVLAGPLDAQALIDGTPAGGIVGSRFPEVTEAVCAALGSGALRIYSTDDIIGVEVASAMVGLLSLAVGYVQRLALGPATLSVMATRGMAEATRLGVALGATEATFHGLAGVGDLISAIADDGRPELLLGRRVAEGVPLADAARELKTHIEGVHTAQRVSHFGERLGFEMPISAVVAKVLGGHVDASVAIDALMARQTTRE
jgi:glycerol-3-phosphate dehydrogenase (NAD(P)+)